MEENETVMMTFHGFQMCDIEDYIIYGQTLFVNYYIIFPVPLIRPYQISTITKMTKNSHYNNGTCVVWYDGTSYARFFKKNDIIYVKNIFTDYTDVLEEILNIREDGIFKLIMSYAFCLSKN